MFGLGPAELLIIGVFALLFIGPKKLPELARGLGKSLREFQKAKNEFQSELDHETAGIKDLDSPAIKSNADSVGHEAAITSADAETDSKINPAPKKPKKTKRS